MKNVFFLAILFVSNLSFAGYGIPAFERKQMLPRQVADLSGLSKQDSRYAKALAACAKNDVADKNAKGVVDYFNQVVQYLTADSFKNSSPQEQNRDLTTARMAVKMLCSVEINALGIDP